MDQKKIIIMTKLAMYEKKHGRADQTTVEHFRRDYIYLKNMWTRLCVGFAGVLVLLVYWAHQILVVQVDFYELEPMQVLQDTILFLVVPMVVFSLIGMVKSTRDYTVASRRNKRYLALLYKLENLKKIADSQ